MIGRPDQSDPPNAIRVEWANGAGGKATVDYLFVDGTYQLMLRDATGHND